jgi:Na+-driven multidrug efflux pump
MFGLAGYGLYAVLWATINLLENIFDLGMTSAMQRTVPQSASDAEAAAALRTAMLFGVGPCLVVAALIAIFAADLAPFLNVAAHDRPVVVPAIQLFVWALPLWAFVEVATSAMRARMVFGAEIRLRIVWEQIMRLVFAGLFFAGGLGLKGLFIAHLCSLAITAALCVRLLARYYNFADLWRGGRGSEIERHTFWAGLSILPSNIIARLIGDAPALILNLLLPGAAGASASALFTIARKLSSVVQLVRIAFVYVMAPLAASAEREDRAQVAEIYAYATRLISAIALPLAAVLAAGSSSLLSLFGAQAHIAQGAVIILLFARALEAVPAYRCDPGRHRRDRGRLAVRRPNGRADGGDAGDVDGARRDGGHPDAATCGRRTTSSLRPSISGGGAARTDDYPRRRRARAACQPPPRPDRAAADRRHRRCGDLVVAPLRPSARRPGLTRQDGTETEADLLIRHRGACRDLSGASR